MKNIEKLLIISLILFCTCTEKVFTQTYGDTKLFTSFKSGIHGIAFDKY